MIGPGSPYWVATNSSAFSPLAIGGVELFVEADNVTEAAGGVSVWGDQGSSGNDLLQGTEGNRPGLVSSWRNSRPALSFNGTTHFLRIAALANGSLSQSYTIVLVGSWDNDNGTGPFAVASAATAFGVRHQGGDPTLSTGANFNSGTSAPASGTAFVMLAEANSSSSKIRFEGHGVAVQNATGNAGTGGLVGVTVGGYGSGSALWAEHIAAVAIYSKVLSDAQKDQLFTHFKNRYAIVPL